MYLKGARKLTLNSKDILSVYITDYLKSLTLLANLNLFDGKLFSSDTVPVLLKKHIPTLKGNDIFEIISFVDFIDEVTVTVTYLKELATSSQKIISFSNIDFSVYANQNSKVKQLIFDEYRNTKTIYDEVLKIRKTIENTKRQKAKNVNLIDFSLLYDGLVKFTQSSEVVKFLEDFKHLSSEGIALTVRDKMLSDMPNDSDIEFKALGQIPPLAIFDKRINYISPIYYSNNSLQVKRNGVLSDFSNYLYTNINYRAFSEASPTYIKDIKELSNTIVLEKIFHINEKVNVLQDFIESVVDTSFIENLVKSGNTNELMKLIADNEDLFSSSNKNEGIFIASLLIKVQEEINSQKETISERIYKIISSKFDIEYRFAEIELYINGIMRNLLDNRRLMGTDSELHPVFYKSLSRIFKKIIFDCFDRFIEEEEKKAKEEEEKKEEKNETNK